MLGDAKALSAIKKYEKESMQYACMWLYVFPIIEKHTLKKSSLIMHFFILCNIYM